MLSYSLIETKPNLGLPNFLVQFLLPQQCSLQPNISRWPIGLNQCASQLGAPRGASINYHAQLQAGPFYRTIIAETQTKIIMNGNRGHPGREARGTSRSVQPKICFSRRTNFLTRHLMTAVWSHTHASRVLSAHCALRSSCDKVFCVICMCVPRGGYEGWGSCFNPGGNTTRPFVPGDYCERANYILRQ